MSFCCLSSRECICIQVAMCAFNLHVFGAPSHAMGPCSDQRHGSSVCAREKQHFPHTAVTAEAKVESIVLKAGAGNGRGVGENKSTQKQSEAYSSPQTNPSILSDAQECQIFLKTSTPSPLLRPRHFKEP